MDEETFAETFADELKFKFKRKYQGITADLLSSLIPCANSSEHSGVEPQSLRVNFSSSGCPCGYISSACRLLHCVCARWKEAEERGRGRVDGHGMKSARFREKLTERESVTGTEEGGGGESEVRAGLATL